MRKTKYYKIGLGDYFQQNGPGVREVADKLEELPHIKRIMEGADPPMDVEEALEVFVMESGDGDENHLIVKGIDVEIVE